MVAPQENVNGFLQIDILNIDVARYIDISNQEHQRKQLDTKTSVLVQHIPSSCRWHIITITSHDLRDENGKIIFRFFVPNNHTH